MMVYLFYKLGQFIACSLPLKIGYAIACAAADIHYSLARNERRAVKKNIAIVLGRPEGKRGLDAMAREVFRNFARYLVDFLRASKLDDEYIRKNVSVEGISNIDDALARGKGVILLSAHIGNWELGAMVLSKLGYPVAAVTLSHQDKMVNDFFARQRRTGLVRPIEIGLSLRACYETLRGNKLLALLGDRDFMKNGLKMKFFGHDALMPKGPAAFSQRMGAAIVPTFMIRNPDDTFRFIFEGPIFSDEPGAKGAAAEEAMMRRYITVLERYIRSYPKQWYVFKDIWSEAGARDLRPDTII